MSRSALIVLFGLLLVAPAAGGPVPEKASGELIVGFREGVSAAEQQRVLGQYSARVKRRFGRIDGVLAAVPADRLGETRRSLEQIRKEVANLTITATEKVTRKSLDDEDHQRLVREALDEVDFSALAPTGTSIEDTTNESSNGGHGRGNG